MKREVEALQWARAVPRPGNIPVGRPRGRKALGVRYEKEFGRAVGPEAEHGLWWEFQDRRGQAVCQTDFLLQSPVVPLAFVLEVKYTWCHEAEWELRRLYLPVVEKALGVPTKGIVVCKALLPTTPRERIVATMEEAMRRAASGLPTVLHWVAGALHTSKPVARPGLLATAPAI